MSPLNYRNVLDVASVQKHIAREGKCIIGISGGADSVCLLHAMHRMTRSYPMQVHAVHVNHLVRGDEAVRDWEFVRSLCEAIGVPVIYREIDPATRKPVGQTTEEYFREQRHAKLLACANDIGAPTIAIGHSSDDLSESLLMHLIRGAGLHGLTFSFSGPCGNREIIRPLWRTPRAVITAYLQQHSLEFREDATNASLEFTRNRIRHLLIPLIEREFNPSVNDALRRTADVLGDAHAFIEEEAQRILENRPQETRDVMPVELIRPVRPILQLEILNSWIVRNLGGTADVSYRVLEELRKFALSSHRNRFHHTTFSVVRSGESLVLVQRGKQLSDSCADRGATSDEIAFAEMAHRYAVSNPRTILARIPEALELSTTSGAVNVSTIDGRTVHLDVSVAEAPDLPIDVVEPSHIDLPLHVRNRMPGDRVSENVRLKSMLINDKVPYYLRDLLVVIADSAGLVLHIVGWERINARLRRSGPALKVHSTEIVEPPSEANRTEQD